MFYVFIKEIRLSMPNKRYVGTIVVDRTAYGFIQCSEFPKNLFYHYSQCRPEEQIHIGDIVSFEIGDGKYGGQQATHVRLEKEVE
jgi:cold shock CspA family protein